MLVKHNANGSLIDLASKSSFGLSERQMCVSGSSGITHWPPAKPLAALTAPRSSNVR